MHFDVFLHTSSLTWHVDHPLAEAGERPTKSSHIKILVQIRHAPARVSSPQKLHTISAAPGDFTSASTKPGDAKMPEPITMPTMKDTDDRSLLIPTRTVSGASAKRVNSESQARGRARGGSLASPTRASDPSFELRWPPSWWHTRQHFIVVVQATRQQCTHEIHKLREIRDFTSSGDRPTLTKKKKKKTTLTQYAGQTQYGDEQIACFEDMKGR